MTSDAEGTNAPRSAPANSHYRLGTLFLVMIGVGTLIKSILELNRGNSLWWGLLTLLVGVVAYSTNNRVVGKVFLVLGLLPFLLFVAYFVFAILVMGNGIDLAP